MIVPGHLLEVLNPIIVTHTVDVVCHFASLYHVGGVRHVPDVMASLNTPTLAVT
jgi:hypothetical protein